MRVQLFTSSAVNTRFGPSDVNGAASDPREMTKAHMQHNTALARLISKMKLGLDMSLLQGSSGVPELPTLDGYSTSVAEDRDELGGGGGSDAGGGGAAPQALSVRRRLALSFRMEQKKILNRELAATFAARQQKPAP